MTYRITANGKLIPRENARPHNAVIIGVDKAENSGWSIFFRGKVTGSGEVHVFRDPDTVEAIINAALARAEVSGIPCVLVLERPWGGSVQTIEALGAAKEAWMAPWRRLAGPLKHKSKVVEVHVSTWRSNILWQTTDTLALELAHASLLVDHTPGPDEAAALCIGAWGCRAGEVAKVIPKAYWGDHE